MSIQLLKDQKLKQSVLTLGADPEIFVFDKQGLIPAFTFLPPKESAISVGGATGLAFWDGFQAEWKHTRPINCLTTLMGETREILRDLTKLARRINRNAELGLQSVVRVPADILQSAQGQHVELGCLPSYNAYGLFGRPVPNPRLLHYRFAGGHMHFGQWRKRPQYEKIVKVLDAFLGVWAVGAARSFDTPVRRRYYGLVGEYRKPCYREGYGLEYRVLSNFFLSHPAVFHLTWGIAQQSVRLAQSKERKLLIAPESDVIRAVNTCDLQLAARLLKQNEPLFRWMLKQNGWNDKAVDKALHVSYEGIESVITNPQAVLDNWNRNVIEGGWNSYANEI